MGKKAIESRREENNLAKIWIRWLIAACAKFIHNFLTDFVIIFSFGLEYKADLDYWLVLRVNQNIDSFLKIINLLILIRGNHNIVIAFAIRQYESAIGIQNVDSWSSFQNTKTSFSPDLNGMELVWNWRLFLIPIASTITQSILKRKPALILPFSLFRESFPLTWETQSSPGKEKRLWGPTGKTTLGRNREGPKLRGARERSKRWWLRAQPRQSCSSTPPPGQQPAVF